jgi:glutamate N-acetyltransferase/amino-acid N-acetyltransferase
LLANGLAGNAEITEEGADYAAFCEALHIVSVDLSKKIAGDGEGCTKLLEAHVAGAPDKETARLVSKSIICSSLFKAAVFASDANWGRILCAIGYTDADFDASNIDVSVKSEVGEVQVCKASASIPFDDDFATEILSKEYVTVEVDLHDGCEDAYAWGCDLTYDYVKINGSYRS